MIDTDTREERDEGERWIDDESDAEAWHEADEEVIPPRPRGRLLRPLPLVLIAIVIAAAGFLGGVLAQKSSEGGSGGSLPGGGELPSFAAAKGGGSETAGEGGASEGATSGLPSFGGSEATAAGTVTSVEGHTIYVKESGGTVVAVKIGDGATVTRNSNVSAKKIHPGDTVTVEGSKNGSTVKASSVAATESGVESTAGGFTPPSGATGGEGGSDGETSVESLFEE
ncbi:MAG TPA: hypothetical protein VMH33_11465 [Solirubrobacterales bacterium]|nr:hypothetical protein [Solirubrobacterales bacterium]